MEDWKKYVLLNDDDTTCAVAIHMSPHIYCWISMHNECVQFIGAKFGTSADWSSDWTHYLQDFHQCEYS